MKERYFPVEENPDIKSRLYWYFGLLIVIIALYLVRAYMLQVNQGDYFRGLADNNRLRFMAVAAPRGLIFDRHGTLLVNNVPEFNLYAVLGDMPSPEAVLNRLDRFVTLEKGSRPKQVLRKHRDRFTPIKVKGGLSLSEIARIEGQMWRLPGLKVKADLKRYSVYGPMTAHLIGYTGEISKMQLASDRFLDLRQGDRVGQFGIEKTYDQILRGSPGKKWVEVDVLGHERNMMRVEQPVAGDDLFLTLDWSLQQAAYEALGDEMGSIVAMDPNTGDILAMVSRPSFDPNLFYGATAAALRGALLRDSNKPLMNRSIQGQYPPGSTFKIIVGTALLEAQGALSTPSVFCNGSFPFGNRVFRDWKKEGHGTVDFRRSLVESCDIYYYTVGSRLGIDTIAKFSSLFGLGHLTGIGLPGEKPGLIPSTQWKKERFKEPWYPGETLSVAIGQGYVQVTPLQMAVMISAVANGGTVYAPRLVQKSRKRGSTQFLIPAQEAGKQIPVLKENLETVRRALADVVLTPRGTASRSKSTIVSFAGKTGTAQVVVLKPGTKRAALPKHLDDHAWFVSYAPAEKPTLAVVVLAEHGGHGGATAAPMAKKVIEAYFAPPLNPPVHGEKAGGSKEPVTAQKENQVTSPL